MRTANRVGNDFENCVAKQGARLKTIVQPYRNIWGRYRLPPGGQYWAVCGQHNDHENNGLKPGSELHHMLECGLLASPTQFYGVDRQSDVIRDNQCLTGHGGQANWIHGDLLQSMKIAKAAGNFNPAIVNYDSSNLASVGAADYAGALMMYLSMFDNVLLICNMVERTFYKSELKCQPDMELPKSAAFRFSSPGWRSYGAKDDNIRLVGYGGGRGDGRTMMSSLIVYRKSVGGKIDSALPQFGDLRI